MAKSWAQWTIPSNHTNEAARPNEVRPNNTAPRPALSQSGANGDKEDSTPNQASTTTLSSTPFKSRWRIPGSSEPSATLDRERATGPSMPSRVSTPSRPGLRACQLLETPFVERGAGAVSRSLVGHSSQVAYPSPATGKFLFSSPAGVQTGAASAMQLGGPNGQASSSMGPLGLSSWTDGATPQRRTQLERIESIATTISTVGSDDEREARDRRSNLEEENEIDSAEPSGLEVDDGTSPTFHSGEEQVKTSEGDNGLRVNQGCLAQPESRRKRERPVFRNAFLEEVVPSSTPSTPTPTVARKRLLEDSIDLDDLERIEAEIDAKIKDQFHKSFGSTVTLNDGASPAKAEAVSLDLATKPATEEVLSRERTHPTKATKRMPAQSPHRASLDLKSAATPHKRTFPGSNYLSNRAATPSLKVTTSTPFSKPTRAPFALTTMAAAPAAPASLDTLFSPRRRRRRAGGTKVAKMGAVDTATGTENQDGFICGGLAERVSGWVVQEWERQGWAGPAQDPFRPAADGPAAAASMPVLERKGGKGFLLVRALNEGEEVSAALVNPRFAEGTTRPSQKLKVELGKNVWSVGVGSEPWLVSSSATLKSRRGAVAMKDRGICEASAGVPDKH